MYKIITDILMYMFEGLIIWHYSNNVFEPKYSKSKNLILTLVAYAAIFGIYQLNVTILNFVSLIVFNFVIIKFLYHSNIKNALFHSVMFLAIMATTEIIIMSLASILYSENIDNHQNSIQTYLFDVMISKLLYFIICMLVMKLMAFKAKRSQKQKMPWVLFIMPLSCIVSMMLLREVASHITLSEKMYLVWCFSTFLMLFANIIVFYIYEKSIKESKELYELKAIQQQNEINETYFTILEQSTKDMHLFAHDLKNHITHLRNLNSVDDIHLYLDELYPNLDKFMSIGISKNKVLDLIISKYKILCENKGVKFYVNIKTANLDYLNDTDLSTILNNLLDNAIEAAECSQERVIYLNIFSKNQMNDAIIIKNSCDTKPFSDKEFLFTTKKEKELHGFGIRSVLKTLNKYNALHNWNYDEVTKHFETTVVIPKNKIIDMKKRG